MNGIAGVSVSALGCLLGAAIIVVAVVVVTGNATWAQLRELAAALRPVAR